MQCPRCHAENREGRRFCGDCGLSFASTCPACGFLNEGSEKFCGGCGRSLNVSAATTEPRFTSPQSYTPQHLAEKILTSKAALEGERKQVTVLFADLKGSMGLLADRDPEEARKLLDPVLEHMMEAVHRYEGTVNQVMGDGIMALFGAPLAHEDHAVRACYAALRMQETVKRYAEGVRRTEGVLIQIRVGLNSGEVVVRSIGSDLHMDYTAVGQTTHLAARMEQLATPGSVLITRDTLGLVEGWVQAKPLGPMQVKGLDAPVEVYEVVGVEAVRSRLHVAAARGLTPFVGRAPEMEQLRLALEHAGGGHGQVVAVVGEPGVGKSRLYWEFTHSHRTQGWLVVESRSVSYGKATSYLPVIDLLKGYFQIEALDAPRRMREKVTGKLLSLDEALRPTLPAFLALLDLPVEDAAWQALEPQQRRQRTLDAVKRLLLRESQVQPVLVIFEDLHWIDFETQALLDSLVESLPTARLLLLVNYRPEYSHGWGSKTYYTQLRIDPLLPENAGALLLSLLGTDPGLQPLTRLLIERTDGNPFFLEESVRDLVETRTLVGDRGAYRLAATLPNIQVPATVQAVVAARMDRLPSEEKRLLQCAAVIGKDVPLPLLQAIAEVPETDLGRSLGRLQTAEFVYESNLFPEVELTFKHALTHEVAYGTLLQERRRALHARVVDAIEQLYADRLTEHVDRLAHHAVRGELWQRAAGYSRQAGTKAAARSALRDSAAWFEQALAALEKLPEAPSTLEQAIDVRLELRLVLILLGQFRRVLERLREADALAGRLGDDLRRGRVWAAMINIHTLLGNMDEALASGTRALAIAQNLGDPSVRLPATSALAQHYLYRGEFEHAIELARENVAAVAALPARARQELIAIRSPVLDRVWLGLGLLFLGRFSEASEAAEDAIRVAEAIQSPSALGWSYALAGTIHAVKGDWTTARTPLEHSIAVMRTGGVLVLLPMPLAARGWVLAYLGEATEALKGIQEAAQLDAFQQNMGLAYGVNGPIDFWFGESYVLVGRLEEARRCAERLLQSAPLRYLYPLGLCLFGALETHADQFNAETGEGYYRRALLALEELGMRPWIAHCHAGLATLHHRAGQRTEADEHFKTATSMYREMGMTHWLEKLEREMRDLA